MFPTSCASFGLCFDSNVNLISFFIICTRLSFSVVHISLWWHRIARQFGLYFCQNVRRKTVIFILFFTRFFCVFRYYPAKQNQLKWWHSADIFTSTDLDGYPPCLILRKFARRGPSVFRQKGCRDLDTPYDIYPLLFNLINLSAILFILINCK